MAVFDDSLQRAVGRISHALDRWRTEGEADQAPHTDYWWRVGCLKYFNEVERNGSNVLLYTAESYAHAVTLARIIIDRVSRGEPTSVIRVGDGEGHFLPLHERVADKAEADRAFIQRVWWGDSRLSAEQSATFESELEQSIRRADIIGVVPAWRLVRDDADGARLLPAQRGIFNGLAYFAQNSSATPIFTSAHLHYDLESWNLWREIFAAISSCSWISCHDLSSHLTEVRGVCTS